MVYETGSVNGKGGVSILLAIEEELVAIHMKQQVANV